MIKTIIILGFIILFCFFASIAYYLYARVFWVMSPGLKIVVTIVTIVCLATVYSIILGLTYLRVGYYFVPIRFIESHNGHYSPADSARQFPSVASENVDRFVVQTKPLSEEIRTRLWEKARSEGINDAQAKKLSTLKSKIFLYGNALYIAERTINLRMYRPPFENVDLTDSVKLDLSTMKIYMIDALGNEKYVEDFR